MQHNGEDIFCPQKKTEKRVRALKCRTLLPRCLWVRLWFRTSLIVKAGILPHPGLPNPSPFRPCHGGRHSHLFSAHQRHRDMLALCHGVLTSWKQYGKTHPLTHWKRTSFREEWKSTVSTYSLFKVLYSNTPDFVEALGTCHQVRHKQTWIKFKILLHSSAVVLHTVGSHGQARPNLKPLQWKIHGSTKCWLVTSDTSCCVIPLAWTPQKDFHATRFTRMIKWYMKLLSWNMTASSTSSHIPLKSATMFVEWFLLYSSVILVVKILTNSNNQVLSDCPTGFGETPPPPVGPAQQLMFIQIFPRTDGLEAKGTPKTQTSLAA